MWTYLMIKAVMVVANDASEIQKAGVRALFPADVAVRFFVSLGST